jgi:hypothetical protein
MADGIGPESPEATPVVDGIMAAFAEAFGAADGTAFRADLLERLEMGTDRRAERYWWLLATINGWSWPEQPTPATPLFEWFIAALRARP